MTQNLYYSVRTRHVKKVRHLLALQAARAAAGLAHPLPRHPRRVVRSAAAAPFLAPRGSGNRALAPPRRARLC